MVPCPFQSHIRHTAPGWPKAKTGGQIGRLICTWHPRQLWHVKVIGLFSRGALRVQLYIGQWSSIIMVTVVILNFNTCNRYSNILYNISYFITYSVIILHCECECHCSTSFTLFASILTFFFSRAISILLILLYTRINDCRCGTE